MRLAVGVGPVEYHSRKSIGEGIGPAFTLSGHALDKMAEPRRLAIITENDGINSELAAFTALLDSVVRSWSKRSMAVVIDSLGNMKQKSIAAALKISQPAVSQRLAVAQWWAVEAATQRWSEVLSQLVAKPNKPKL